MSFGAEFRNMRQAGGAPKLTPEVIKEAAEVAATKASAEPEVVDPDAHTFGQPFVDQQTIGEETDDTPPVIPPPKAEAKKIPVKINGKTFETIEDATEYASNLERELEKKEAFEKGKESALPKEIKPAEVKKLKKIADKLFEDPEAAMEELEAHFNEMAEKRLEERENQKTAAQLKSEQMKKDTEDFYKNNADLSDWQDEVNWIVTRNWDTLVKLPKDQIMSETARLAREYVSSTKERALPKQTLSSRVAQTSSQGGKSTTATPTNATEKKLSFSEQVRSTNRRTTAEL